MASRKHVNSHHKEQIWDLPAECEKAAISKQGLMEPLGSSSQELDSSGCVARQAKLSKAILYRKIAID